MAELVRSSPAALRNRDAILEVLADAFADHGAVRDVLEIASGTGEHIERFAAAMPQVRFQPTDMDPEYLAAIAARLGGLPNVAGVATLDVLRPWPDLAVDAVLVANMFHISPVGTVAGFMAGAAGVLRPGGLAHIYGPFKQGGQHTAVSNEAFHDSLTGRNPEWGIRDLEAVLAEAERCGLVCAAVREMPANNLSVMLRRS